MIIVKLHISSVRNIIMAAIYPSPTLNFIVGKNASGKSAFLEAIFLLGRIKSFRSTALEAFGLHFGPDHSNRISIKYQSQPCSALIHRHFAYANLKEIQVRRYIFLRVDEWQIPSKSMQFVYCNFHLQHKVP